MGEKPLTDADYDRLADALNRFHGDRAMNLEQLDGFFAALICGPNPVHPSEYLPEIWGGGEMADEEAFASQQQLKDFLDLVMRHWNAIAETLQSGDVHLPRRAVPKRRPEVLGGDAHGPPGGLDHVAVRAALNPKDNRQTRHALGTNQSDLNPALRGVGQDRHRCRARERRRTGSAHPP